MTKITYYKFVKRCGSCNRVVSSYIERVQPSSWSETEWCPYCQQYTIVHTDPGIIEEIADE